jgi:hypothetical protein
MRQILVLLGILFTLTLKAQEEFSRAYLNVLISYDDSLSFYSGANAFTFNVDGNSILYYPHSGETERFIYVSGIMEDKDRYGDEYQMIKTIEVKTSEIVYNPFSSRLQTSPLDKIYMETRETARYMFSSPSYVFSPSL